MNFKIATVIAVFAFVYHGANAFSKVDRNLLETFENENKANIFINMKEGTSSTLERIRSTNYISRSERLVESAKLLQANAENSQKLVKSFLEENGLNYKSFWISNQIYIPGASLSLVKQLSALDQVSEIVEEVVVQLAAPAETEINIEKLSKAPRETSWGVSKIQADQVWELVGGTTGEGIVVGNIDTGVRGTHQDLRTNFRADHGWRDAISQEALPYDDNGHGTHTMGTLVGENGIGVAPGAQWISCKGCSGSGACTTSGLLECGQFMQCPTLPDGSDANCTLAPSVVSNSWGGGSSSFFDPVLEAWVAAGIYPFFSLGNSGPSCSTVGLPAANENVIAVAATGTDDKLSTGSSQGPSADGEIKPDVSAPGQQILSAWNAADDSYATLSGSSMASPHAAGAGALILSAKQLDYEEFKSVLFDGCDTESLTPPGTNCGDIDDSTYPNNAYGYGRINAYNSVLAVISSK